MKSILHFSFTIFLFLSMLTKVSATPLSGNYTIGSGGDFNTIGSAVEALDTLGISSPVGFRILNGNYPEFNVLTHVTGSSLVNTITFESFSGNPDDVTISFSPNVFRINNAMGIIIRNLTLGNIELRGTCFGITIAGNKFSNAGITQTGDLTDGLEISNNTGMSGIIMTAFGLIHQDVSITDNVFNTPFGFISISNCNNLLIEDNKLSAMSIRVCTQFKIVRNKIEFFGATGGGFDVQLCQSGTVINNFTMDNTNLHNIIFRNDSALFVVNNTFRNESAGNDTTVSVFDNNNFVFKNNIVTNTSGFYLMSYHNNTALDAIYNVYFNGTAANLIKHDGTSYDDLAALHAATGLEGGSIVRDIDFVSSSDLHLDGFSIGDVMLAGAPDPLVTDDIDGEPRSGLHPYRGADEADAPLPVELASFTSVVQDNNVVLHWQTLSEENNSGFEIERAVTNENSSSWIKVGFVEGKGNQSNVNDYSFRDIGLTSGKYNYRLKQIDFNGSFNYYNLRSEVIIGAPATFGLSQNYPNPFNPATKINYSLPSDGKVLLKIFDVTGKEVRTLVNELQTSGYYSIDFRAENLGSGVYYYTMTSGNFRETRKMMVIK